jgi:hypothetical protein
MKLKNKIKKLGLVGFKGFVAAQISINGQKAAMWMKDAQKLINEHK